MLHKHLRTHGKCSAIIHAVPVRMQLILPAGISDRVPILPKKSRRSTVDDGVRKSVQLRQPCDTEQIARQTGPILMYLILSFTVEAMWLW